MNKLKRVLCGTLALAMAASMMTACGDDASSTASNGGGTASGGSDSTGGGASGDKTKVKVMTFTDETQTMLDIFCADEANKAITDKYEFEVSLESTASTYIQNVLSDLAGDNAPDLFLADADYAKQFAEQEQTASIADLGITINEDDYYKYTLDFTSRQSDGTRMGLSHQAAPGVVLYRTDYAEQVLGSKDPADVQAAMSDWDKFVETAKKMQENGIFMINGLDELKRCFMNNRDGAWLKDDMTYYCDEATVTKFFETTKELADAGCVQYMENTQWTTNWYNGMQDGVFCFFGCTWYLHYTIKPNCLTTKTGDVDADGNATAADADYKVGNGSYGLWGIVQGPAPYFWGGTWWFGSKKCLEDGTAEAVKAVIEYFCVNDDSMKAYMEKTGDFPSKPGVAEQLSSNNDFLGGQDHYAIFREAAKNVNTKTTTMYDDTFNTAVNDALIEYIVNGMSLDDAIAYIKDKAAETITDMK